MLVWFIWSFCAAGLWKAEWILLSFGWTYSAVHCFFLIPWPSCQSRSKSVGVHIKEWKCPAINIPAIMTRSVVIHETQWMTLCKVLFQEKSQCHWRDVRQPEGLCLWRNHAVSFPWTKSLQAVPLQQSVWILLLCPWASYWNSGQW